MARPIPKQWYPKNPKKYQGNYNNIIARSSWEVKLFKWLDTNPDVISWASEELAIPYFLETDRKMHRYFPDALFTIKDPNTGTLSTYLAEVKPNAQIQKPKQVKRITEQHMIACATYIQNQNKWAAADAYAKQRGWKFITLSEFDLGIAKRPNK